MPRTVPGTDHWLLHHHLVLRLSAPDVAGASATGAGFGGLLVFVILSVTSAPAFLTGFIGAVTLALLVAGVALPLLAATYESP